MTTETTIAETVHRVVSAWKGDEPGSCGIECSCGDTFDGFDSIAEAEACHKPLRADKPEPAKAEPDPRAEYIRGLREIADWLEAHPEVPLPSISSYQAGSGYQPTLTAYLHGDQKATLARVAKAMGKADKVFDEDGRDMPQLRLVRRFAGIAFVAAADRDEVCERISTGVELVTRKVKDPEALAAVPEVEVTEEVETFEWRCTSILAGADA